MMIESRTTAANGPRSAQRLILYLKPVPYPGDLFGFMVHRVYRERAYGKRRILFAARLYHDFWLGRRTVLREGSSLDVTSTLP